MIPPGVHLLSTSPKSNAGTNEMDSAIAIFINLEPGQVLVLQWDPVLESLRPHLDNDQAARLAIAVRNFEFDANLGAYPIESWQKWCRLTSHLNRPVVERVQPLMKYIFSASLQDSVPFVRHRQNKISETPRPSIMNFIATPANDISPSRTSEKLLDENTTEISKSTIGAAKPITAVGSSPQDITRFNLDKSDILLDAIQQCRGNDANTLLGELQFSFIAFLIGQNSYCANFGLFEHDYTTLPQHEVAFEHWKRLVSVFCSSCSAITTHGELFLSFFKVIGSMLDEIPADFFIDPLSSDSFLRSSLKDLFTNVDSLESVSVSLAHEIKLVRQVIQKKFGWKMFADDVVFNETRGCFEAVFENDEEAPVIVDDVTEYGC